jgi:hypothetical protein
MDARVLREAALRASPSFQRAGRRTYAAQLLESPSGIVHLGANPDSLQPLCMHYEPGVVRGWSKIEGDWNQLPEGRVRCRTCIARA